MKKRLWTVFLALGMVALLSAQQNPQAEIRIKKIDVDLKSAPRYTVTPTAPSTDQTAKWLIVEAELESVAEWADEVTVKFFVVANYGSGVKGSSVPPDGFDILSASVTVVNMQKNFGTGKKNIVPVFMDANTVKKYGQAGKTQFIPQVAVQVMYKGAVQDLQWMSAAQKGVRFWETKSPKNGVLMNLIQSPWFPAYAEYYEQVKSASIPTP